MAVQELLSSLPSLPTFARMRSGYVARHTRSGCEDLRLARGVIFRYPENVELGSPVFVNRNSIITARSLISIGSKVLIGAHVIIDSGGHRFSDLSIPIWDQGVESAPIEIGNDVWIGAGSIILSGTSIGSSTVIGAGSVVKGHFESGVVAAGVPAKVIRRR